MPDTHPTGDPPLSSDASRLLAVIVDHPGHESPTGWARVHDWSADATVDAYAELVAAGLAHPAGPAVRLLLPQGLPPSLAYRAIDPARPTDRAVLMAWIDGHRTVRDIARRTRLPRRTIWRCIRRLASDGLAYTMGTAAPTEAGRKSVVHPEFRPEIDREAS